MDSFIAHSRHPLEEEVADTTRLILEREKFPFDRLRVEVKYDLRMKCFSDHDLKEVRVENRQSQGTVGLFFNRLFIVQRPDSFLRLVVPHEIAHVITQLKATVQGVKIEKHGVEWRSTYARFATNSPQEHASINALFDDRAIALYKGYVSARCECSDASGFHCIAPSQQSKVQGGHKHCSRCNTKLRIVPPSEIPTSVKEALDYLHENRYTS